MVYHVQDIADIFHGADLPDRKHDPRYASFSEGDVDPYPGPNERKEVGGHPVGVRFKKRKRNRHFSVKGIVCRCHIEIRLPCQARCLPFMWPATRKIG